MVELTLAQRIARDAEARRMAILQADARMGDPDVMTMPPAGLVPPMVDQVGLSGSQVDDPVMVAPYGITPDLPDFQDTDLFYPNPQPRTTRTPPHLTPQEQQMYATAERTGDQRTMRQLEGVSNGRTPGVGRNLRNVPTPDAMTASPMGITTPSFDQGVGLAGSQADQPVVVAPYGVTPEIPDAQDTDDIITLLQEQDETRPSVGRARIDSRADVGEDPVAPYLTTPRDKGGPIFTGNPDTYAPGDPYVLAPVEPTARPQMRPDDLMMNFSDPDLLPGEYEKPGSTVNNAGTGGTGKPAGAGLAEDAGEADAELNAIQRFARDRFGMDEGQRSDLARALIMGGAATMAGTSPFAGVNIGKGIQAGAGEYYDAEDERRTRAIEDEALDWKREDRKLARERTQLAIDTARKELEKAANPYGSYKPLSPAGKLWADATRLSALQGGSPTPEEIMEEWISIGIYNDPRDGDII